MKQCVATGTKYDAFVYFFCYRTIAIVGGFTDLELFQLRIEVMKFQLGRMERADPFATRVLTSIT